MEFKKSICEQVRANIPNVEINPRGEVTTLNLLRGSGGTANISETSESVCVEFSNVWSGNKGITAFRIPKKYSLNIEGAKAAAEDIISFLNPYIIQTLKLKNDGYVKYEGKGTKDDTVKVRRWIPNDRGGVDLSDKTEDVSITDLDSNP